MTDELMLKLLTQSHDDLKEVFEAGIRGLQQTVGANAEVAAIEAKSISVEVSAIVKRLDRMNGNVARLQEESNKRQQAVDDFRRLEANCKYKHDWPKKNLLYLIAGGIVAILVVVVLYDVLGLRGIIELVKGI